MSFKVWIPFLISFPSPWYWYTRKLERFSYRDTHTGDFVADCVLVCLTCFSVSVFSKNWHPILSRFMFEFLSFIVCKVLLCVLSGSLSNQGLGLPCEYEGHVSNNERQHSQLFTYVFYVILSFCLYLHSTVILEGSCEIETFPASK